MQYLHAVPVHVVGGEQSRSPHPWIVTPGHIPLVRILLQLIRSYRVLKKTTITIEILLKLVNLLIVTLQNSVDPPGHSQLQPTKREDQQVDHQAGDGDRQQLT